MGEGIVGGLINTTQGSIRQYDSKRPVLLYPTPAEYSEHCVKELDLRPFRGFSVNPSYVLLCTSYILLQASHIHKYVFSSFQLWIIPQSTLTMAHPIVHALNFNTVYYPISCTSSSCFATSAHHTWIPHRNVSSAYDVIAFSAKLVCIFQAGGGGVTTGC